ncbi:MAG: BACON domain-containing protein [Gemmatimonadales bacterium]
MRPPLWDRSGSRPAATSLATGCLLLALACSVTTCRLDSLVKPQIRDRLIISPAVVLDSAHAGSQDGVSDTLRLVSADGGGATLSWRAVAPAPWVILSSNSGGAPDSVIVTLRADTLSQSLRHDSIAFTAVEMPGDTFYVPITFNVLAPAPDLQVTPASNLDSALAGSRRPRSFVVYLDNTGGLPLTWSATSDQPWLTLSPSSGGAPPRDSTVVTLSADTLAAGLKTGTITITAPGAIGSPFTLDVTFKVTPCAPTPVVADTIVTGTIVLDDCGAPDRAGSLAKQYRLLANAGDTLSLRLSSAAFDAYLTLLDSLGTVLAQNDDCPGQAGPSCILGFRAPATGRYVIEATTLAAADTGSFTLSAVRERAPGTPQSIAQLRGDSVTAIVIGQTNSDTVTVFKAVVSDSNARDSVRLEVEAVPVASPFSNTPTQVSAFVAVGQQAWIRARGLAENAAHHWQARACDKTARCSAWVSFGGNSELAADFLVNAVAENPSIDALSLNQFTGATVIPIGGGTGGSGQQTVTFKAAVSDPDPGDVLVIELEAKQTNAAFDGSSGLSRGTGVASGATASVAVVFSAPLLGSNNYHWRARACDQTNRCSAWAPFGGNSDVVTAATDYHVP